MATEAGPFQGLLSQAERSLQIRKQRPPPPRPNLRDVEVRSPPWALERVDLGFCDGVQL